MAGRSLDGGGGNGPVGGGALDGKPEFCTGVLLFAIDVLLLVRGGKKGLWVGSIAEAGSGILSRLPNPRRFALEVLPGGTTSLVSSDKCCNEIGGGGDFSTIPVGAEMFWPPATSDGY